MVGICQWSNTNFLAVFNIIVIIVNLFFAAIKCNKKLSERKDEITLLVEMLCLPYITSNEKI